MLKSIYQIIQELKSTNSKNDKTTILYSHRDNELLKKVLKYTYDNRLSYGIKKIPEYISNGMMPFDDLAFMLLDRLNNRNITGNNAISELKSRLKTLTPNSAKVLELIIQRDLDCGVAKGLINDALGKGFIPEFPTLLCSSFKEKNLKKIKYPAIAQIKEDGERFEVITTLNVFEIKTRNGKIFDFLGELAEEFRSMISEFKDECVFDGEFRVLNEARTGYLDRKTGNGIVNKALKGTITKEEASRIVAVCWDAIPYKHFLEGKSNIPYENRFNYLTSIYNRCSNPERIRIVEYKEVNSLEEAMAYYDEVYSRGEEGIILKNKDAIWNPYECGEMRSPDQVKIKAVLDCDLKINNYFEGEGKYKGKCGSLECVSADGNLVVCVKPRTDGLAEEIWNCPSNFINKIIAVKFNAVINNKKRPDEKYSLFLPRMIEIREDKDEADTTEYILSLK